MTSGPPRPRGNRRLLVLVAALIMLVAVVLLGGPQIRREVSAWSLARAAVPDQSAFEDLLQSYPDPVPCLERMFATGKIVHRELVMEAINRQPKNGLQRDGRIERLLWVGAHDPDASTREVALGGLATSKSPLLLSAASVQLEDADPLIRLLGVQALMRIDPQSALPRIVPLLDDPDPRVVTMADAALKRWTGIDTGARIAQSISRPEMGGNESNEGSNRAAIQKAVAQRKDWWALHRNDFPLAKLEPSVPPAALSTPARVDNFTLLSLNGGQVNLSDFRGKLVLLNFWTTWCTACISETPDLVELQKRYADRFVILGISLDGVPDDHGHGAGEHSESTGAAESHDGSEMPSLAAIRAKVTRTCAARGMTYRVLLDSTGQVGSRFNGGELPTNVLIDADGRIRRRFVGGRSLAVWDAMIAELAPRAR